MRCRIRLRPEGLLAVVLALGAAACQEQTAAGLSDAPSQGAPVAAGYADELARIDADIARHRAAAGDTRDAWPAHERLARSLLDRAHLSGRFEDYAGSVEAAAAAEGLGGPRASCATRARVALAVHRLASAAEALADCARTDADTELAALAADLAFQQGRYGNALRQARQVLERRETPGDLARLALVHAATGAPTEALALLDRAEKIDHAGAPALRAWLALQRGLIALHRGRWEEALAHYLAAERRLAGWWLVGEHIAEVRALLGQSAEAAAIYRRLLEAHPHAELMDAYARLLGAMNRTANAAAWTQRAREAHRRRQALLPEAADGHALLHFLDFEPRAHTTLELARRNAALRPSGTARVALARALLAAGRPQEAVTVLQAAGASGWDTAELHAVAHQALLRARLDTRAAGEAALAVAMNPRWQSQYAPRGAPQLAPALYRP